MKGRSAADELADATPALRKVGMTESRVAEHGADVLETPTLTVDCVVVPKKKAGRRR